MVEFALVIPIVLLLMFAAFDVGRVLFVHALLQEAAQEGARYGIVTPDDDSGIRSVVQYHLTGLDAARTTIDITRTGGEDLGVQVSYRLPIVTPMISALFNENEVQLEGSATMLY